MKTFVLAFLVLALAVAFAGTVPGAHSYTVTFEKPVLVNGTKLAAGDYRLTVAPDKVTLTKDKVVVPVPASIETSTTKFSDTVIGLNGDNLREIRLGGTKTRIVVKSN